VSTRQELESRLESSTRQITALQQQLDAMIEASRDDNADDEHDPEGSTIAFERQQLASLLERARSSERDARHALAQLDAGTYGRCESCGKPIAPERLEARPDARLCIDCARRG
jgi:RNA polymerase-binding transcription factor DksA